MIRIGKIVATHGLNGSLVITHVAGSAGWLKSGDALMVEMLKESYIPHFVETVKSAGKEECTVTFEEIVSVEQAKRLIGKSIFVNERVLEQLSVQSPLLWIGFAVNDVVKGNIGIISDVFQAPGQWLAKLYHGGNEVLIPLTEPILRKVNVKNRWILVNLPDGLLEVYQ